jgi:phosphatidylserine/phosphatidylglycerophosphate/cardiolipin synthase-like enzyme
MPAKDVTNAPGLQLAGYAGANCSLIAMSVPEDQTDNLAGFAIWRRRDGEAEQALVNRLNFNDPVTGAKSPGDGEPTSSEQAPFQKFRWVDVPPDGLDKATTYRVRAMYFSGAGKSLRPGAEARVTVAPVNQIHSQFHAAFTRGYISSQAYAEKFHNADIRPKGAKTPDFDTKPYQPQYQWLGAGARQALFDFLADCRNDKQCKVDVFAYDLDEPDVVAAICEFGKEKRLRAVLDNASLHTGTAPEVRAAQMIKDAAGSDNVVQGHFSRFQHNKVFLKRSAAGGPQRVLFGSMNFSVRGLYVQSNNIIVADDPNTAKYFAAAFDNAFQNRTSTTKFTHDQIAGQYNTISDADTSALPKAKVALSPHADPSISLAPATTRVRAAKSSVFYAVMQPTGGGNLLSSLRTIAANPTVFSYGTVETSKGLAVQRGDGAMGDVASFAYLKSKVPYPFNTEFDPGPGIHIHDKFLVIDFNGDNPAVFTGSSNLAEGGEKANGDSLIMIEDKVLAEIYAIEALKMFDHYSFRDKMKTATDAKPLTLWYPGKLGEPTPWWQPFYNREDVKYRDRCLFAGIALPPDLPSQKNVDWSSLDGSADGGKKPSQGKKGRKSTTKRAASKAAPKKKAAKKARKTAKRPKAVRGKAAKRAARKKAAPKKATSARRKKTARARKTPRKTRR